MLNDDNHMEMLPVTVPSESKALAKSPEVFHSFAANNSIWRPQGWPSLSAIFINGHSRNQLIGGTDSIYKANFLSLCKGIYPQNMARNMVQYLHFRILEFPLISASCWSIGAITCYNPVPSPISPWIGGMFTILKWPYNPFNLPPLLIFTSFFITHRIHIYIYIYGNIYHQYTPNVGIYTHIIYYAWILWLIFHDLLTRGTW